MYFILKKIPPSPENRAVYTMGKNTKRIVALALQQWLCERATMLLYTFIACLVILSFLSRSFIG